MRAIAFSFTIVFLFLLSSCKKEKNYIPEIEDSMLMDSVIGTWFLTEDWECYLGDTLHESGTKFRDTFYFEQHHFQKKKDTLIHEWYVNSGNRKLYLYFTQKDPLFGSLTAGLYYATDIIFVSYDSILLQETYYRPFDDNDGEDVYAECHRSIILKRL